MNTLLTYLNDRIFESNFSWNKDQDAGYTKYIIPILMKMAQSGELRLGEHGEDGIYYLTPEQKKAALDLISSNKTFNTLSEFNEWVISQGMPSLKKLFKGDFSGYIRGLASKNRGNAFEVDFLNNFDSEYRGNLEKYLGLEDGSLIGSQLTKLGERDNLRPLTFNGKNIIVGSKRNAKTVGDDVVDVLLTTPDGEDINLSLKFGNTVTFINCGVKTLFPDKSFTSTEDGYKPEENGKKLLDMLCVDYDRFADVFNSYKGRTSRAQYDEIDITKSIKNNRIFEDFVESVVGYNYILVHKLSNGDVQYYDLRTKRQMKQFIGKIQSAVVRYPVEGSAKRVNIVVELDNLILIFNIRSKSGTVYPTHIMADYKIKH